MDDDLMNRFLYGFLAILHMSAKLVDTFSSNDANSQSSIQNTHNDKVGDCCIWKQKLQTDVILIVISIYSLVYRTHMFLHNCNNSMNLVP